ncbi:MAG: group II intron reverse transcriptase/maturase [Candidatus Eisenbacteria bacterium]|nr:group II intron reverse transcriptase/maturase [Candidatus Eisenbacteria bacterium]
MRATNRASSDPTPAKQLNNAPEGVTETVEGRGPVKGNTVEQNAPRTQSRTGCAPSALDRVRQAAARDRKLRFTSLLHHVSVDRLREAYFSTKRTASPGPDGETWSDFGEDLELRLEDLHRRIHRGAYRAKPSRRAFIPKADGSQRPLAVAALEDKVVQRAVATVLSAIYEQDFLGFSYGFRPRRNPHMALDALATGIERKRVNWVLDADIRGFFDAIDHTWMLRFLEHRIADRRLLRLIRKWLRAGVLEDGVKRVQGTGSPQGASLSPLLANVYLHYVFDLWTEYWRQKHARGDVIVVRFADDIVLGFQYKADAERLWADLRARLRKFCLELHPRKTRLLRFGSFADAQRKDRGEGKPETFDFLGFTHVCARTRIGRFHVQRLTAKSRMRARLRSIREELMRRRHLPLAAQGRWIRQVVRGYFAYHAVPKNGARIAAFRVEVRRAWIHALRRRSQRTRMTWSRFQAVADPWIPKARILHPWPTMRFDVRTQGRSPVR